MRLAGEWDDKGGEPPDQHDLATTSAQCTPRPQMMMSETIEEILFFRFSSVLVV